MHKAIAKDIRNNKYETVGDGSILVSPSKVQVGGYFTHWLGKEGQEDLQVDKNIVVDEGLNHILDISVSNGTQETAWFIAVFKANYTPVAGDVGLTFPGAGVADEATTEYDEAARPTWVDAGVSGKTVTNSASQAVFTFNTTVSIYGAFMISGSVKASTSDVLLAASRFAAVRNLVNTDVLNVTYTLNIADV